MAVDAARLAYYLGAHGAPCAPAAFSDAPAYNAPFWYACGRRVGARDVRPRREWRYFRPYADDMEAFCARVPRGTGFVVQFGDRPPAAYALAKARRVARPCAALLPLNTARHWRFAPEPREPPWHAKRAALVWRGATTGHGLRRRFVHALFREHDVRFHAVVQHREAWVADARQLGPSLTRREILAHRYVLSLPGNDVATNLKWLMASGSVVVMPPPTVEGWLLEGLLVPWVHYVPLARPNETARVLAWLRAHDAECRAIVRRANAWVAEARAFEPYLSAVLARAANRTWGHARAPAVPPSGAHFE